VDYPWGIGVATGVGSLPFDDRDEAARVVFGELGDFPHVPELPNRGAGADMIGRTAALLVEMPVDLQPSGWRLVDRPGADVGRARSLLRGDLDAVEIAAHGYSGPLKIQVTGPLTLAAAIDRPRGDRVLADHGARRDLAQSLAEGLTEHVTDVAARVPGAQVVVQVDEPSLPHELAGAVPTSSGFGRLRAVDIAQADELLSTVLAAAGSWPVVHCCATDVPVDLIRRAGATAVSLDVGQLDKQVLEQLAASVDAGLGLWPGIVPSTRPASPLTDSDLARRLERLFDRIDADAADVLQRTVVTPTCGLAGADGPWVREAYELASRGARALAELVGSDG
jgi:methionine synthase II (cobalamin-independent)